MRVLRNNHTKSTAYTDFFPLIPLFKKKMYILVLYTYSLRICSNSPPQAPNFQ